MKTKRLRTLGLAALLALPAAFVTPALGQAEAASPAVPARKGFITGRVVNEQGQPMAGVEVVADNTLAYDSNLIVYTNAKGEYSIDVSRFPVTFNVTASKKIEYDDFEVKVDLVPENKEVVPGVQGGVRNFVFRPKKVTQNDPYGNLAYVVLEHAIGEYDVDSAQVQVTLTPVGKLADGSTGAPKTYKLIQTGSGWLVPNIMWGTYKVTATLNGKALQLRRRAPGRDDAWNTTYTGGFTMDYYSTKPNMYLEVRTAR